MLRKKAKPKVIVAMSGGVDSSVSAALLEKAGFNVTGMYIKCWTLNDPLGHDCTSGDDERMARLAAAKIGIPFYSLNFVAEYKKRVVEYLLQGYKNGITPNPDVMCNKEIKFGLFFEKALSLGADFVATGHYARVHRPFTKKGSMYQILKGKDEEKDQSYFLSFVDPGLLPKILFPIGNYEKAQVRELAKKFDLPNAERRDSQGICFIGKVDFVDFLKHYISPKEGDIVDMQGNVLGKHEGVWYYTIGQRKGLSLSGGPYFVVDKDLDKNMLVVSKDEKDLEKTEVLVKNMNWFDDIRGSLPMEVTARTRYRQTPAAAILKENKAGPARRGGGEYTLLFKEPQRAIAPGQLAVVYQDDQMLAGGVIQ